MTDICVSQNSNSKWIVKFNSVIEFEGTICECYAFIQLWKMGVFK